MSRCEVEKPVLTFGIGREGSRDVDALDGDDDARQYSTLFVFDNTCDVPALELGENRFDRRQRECESEKNSLHGMHSFELRTKPQASNLRRCLHRCLRAPDVTSR